MISTDQIQLIQSWHNAVNNKSLPALQMLVIKDVEIGGPRGTTQGIDALMEWVSSANVKLHPQRFFAKNDIILVEQLGQWHSKDSNKILSELHVYTIFIIKEQRITSILRYDDKEMAFEKAGLTEEDEVEANL